MKMIRLIVTYGVLLSITLPGAVACMSEESTEEYAEEASDGNLDAVQAGDEALAERDSVADNPEIIVNSVSGCTTELIKKLRLGSSFCTHGTGTHRVRLTCVTSSKLITRFGPWVATRTKSTKQCAAGETARSAAVDTRD
jgi:hypothetical protein